MDRSHWCFDCSRMVNVEDQSFCKEYKHDIDFEDEFRPGNQELGLPTPQKRSKDEKHNLVEFASKNILDVIISDTDSSQIFGLIEINDHKEVLNLGTNQAVEWLTSQYYTQSEEFHGHDMYEQVLNLIRSKARFNRSIKHEAINKRVASDKDSCYIDLGNDEFKLVKIDSNEVKIVDHSERTPKFSRSKSQTVMPTPTLLIEDSPLEEFAKLVRMEDDKIFLPHLITMLLPHIATPIMFITGQEDSAKSIRSALIKKLIDPSGNKLEEQLGSFGRNTDDISVHFANNYLSVFDNVSYISHENSDTLCKAITGSSYSKRKNYEDSEEVILKYQRKIILTGIGVNIEHSDLARRTIHYFTKRITQQERKTVDEVNEKFKSIQSQVLGQICNVMQQAYKIYPDVSKEIKEIPGMADFAIWGECISRALGRESNDFITTYKARLEENSQLLNENNCIIPFIESEFSGTDQQEITYQVGMWHGKLSSFAERENYDTKAKSFPKGSGQLRGYVDRSKPLLDEAEFEIKFTKNTDNKNFTKGSILMTVRRTKKQECIV